MKNIGGQAVIEGVMMKSPLGWSVAVRGPGGDISTKTVIAKKQSLLFKLPLIRGVVALAQALTIGIKAIEFSGNIAYQEKENKKPISPLSMGISIGAAIILAVVLFKFLPLLLTTLMAKTNNLVSKSSFVFNLMDGLLRVGIFFLYIFSIGLWKEMRRIYEYHGAEHKVIHAYEAGVELMPDNIKNFKPFHPRCGTSFLLIVMVTSILIFMFIPREWSFWEKLISRLMLVPVIAGVSYEILRFAAKKKDNHLMGLLILPGLLLQRMTVKEPDDSQIEVAIVALKEVLKLETKEVYRQC